MTTTGTLTADDRKLLREVFRAAHARSWTRVHNDPDWKEPGSRYWSNDHNTPIELDKHGWVKTPISEVECVDIQMVVDILVAVGVLPDYLRSRHVDQFEAVGYPGGRKAQWYQDSGGDLWREEPREAASVVLVDDSVLVLRRTYAHADRDFGPMVPVPAPKTAVAR